METPRERPTLRKIIELYGGIDCNENIIKENVHLDGISEKRLRKLLDKSVGFINEGYDGTINSFRLAYLFLGFLGLGGRLHLYNRLIVDSGNGCYGCCSTKLGIRCI